MHEVFIPLIIICLYMKLFSNKVAQVHCILIFRGSSNIPCILLLCAGKCEPRQDLEIQFCLAEVIEGLTISL